MTLVVASGVATGGGSPVSTVEVATDAAFTTIVTTQIVSPGANGQLTITLGHLSPATTYYWRVKTTAGDNPGVYSSPASFSIGPQAVLSTPVLVSPPSGVLIGDLEQPITLVVQNPAISQKVGSITNSFDVATDAAFGNVVVSKNVPQGPSDRTSVMLDPLPPSAAYYWRVRAAASDTIGAVSGTSSFRIGSAVSGRYQFTISIPSCDTTTPIMFVFDGSLTRSAETLRFTMNPYGDLMLQVGARAGRVSGTLVSNASTTANTFSGGIPIFVRVSATNGDQHGPPATPVDVSGVVNADGQMAGVFDGYLSSWNYYDGQYFCHGGFSWTLGKR